VSERSKDEIWEQRTEWPLALVAIAFLAMYSVHVLYQPRGAEPTVLSAVAWVAWSLFVSDYIVRLTLSSDRRQWLLHHLFELVIVAVPLMGPLRLLRVVVLVGALEKAVGAALRGRIVIYTTAGVVLLIYVGSLATLAQERGHPGATITSFGKAVWWAITTVTSVGYGDLYPVTVMGRVIAVLLMIGGISLIGVVTAALASWIVERVSESRSADQALSPATVDELRNEMRALSEDLRRTQHKPPGNPGQSRRERTNRSVP
jgi:voltage-gated potassium channel